MMTSSILLMYLLQAASMIGLPIETSNIEQAQCLAQNIFYEARSEDISGQFAVASVTLNRANDPRYPNTVCGVVKQSAISIIDKKPVCAFTWYCENRKTGKTIAFTNKDGSINEKIVEQFKLASMVAILTLNGEVDDNTKGATHFHNPQARPSWAATMIKTATIGNHTFYK